MKNTIKYKVIKDLEQYNKYCDEHEKLMTEDEEKHQDEIDLLELLIEDYDEKIMREKGSNLKPVELLRTMLKEAGISQSELSKALNVSKQLINDVLAYRRNISKEMTIKLAEHFSMSQEAFSRKYELKNPDSYSKKTKMFPSQIKKVRLP